MTKRWKPNRRDFLVTATKGVACIPALHLVGCGDALLESGRSGLDGGMGPVGDGGPVVRPEPRDPVPLDSRIQLSASRLTGTAPAGFFFSATVVDWSPPEGKTEDTFDPYFDVRYRWDFSDPGHYTRHDTEDLPWGKYYEVDGELVLVEDGSVPSGDSVSFLGNDKNVAFGPHCCHVFEKPGEYLVTCEVQGRGQAALGQTLRITVEDPNAVFPGQDTVCVASNGDFSGAPAGSLQVTSYVAAMRAISDGPAKRVLFRRGLPIGEPVSRSDRWPTREGGYDNIQFGAFGSGSDPTFRNGMLLRVNPGGEYSFWGLNFVGAYDPSRPNGSAPSASGFEIREDGFKTIWDCQASGGSKLITLLPGTQHLTIGNFSGANWFDYGIFAGQQSGFLGFCGVWIKQNPDTGIGPGKGEGAAPYYPDHGPFRCSLLSAPFAFNLVDVRSIGSWTGSYQPCLRVGRGAATGNNKDEAVFDRIRGENGVMLGSGSTGQTLKPRRYLWDKIYNVVMPEGDTVMSPSVSGMHYRNMLVVIPRVPKVSGNMRYWVTRGEPAKGGTDGDNIRNFGVTIMNSTLVDLRTFASMRFDTAQMEQDYRFVQIANNVVHAPNKADPSDTGSGPLDPRVMWATTNPGMRVETAPLDRRFETVGTGAAAFYTPQADSSARGGATGPHVAVDDFFGRIRGDNTSQGALD